MENQESQNHLPHPVTRHISALAGEFNIARRNWSAYPPGHPMIEASFQKLSRAWNAIAQEYPSLKIGVTKEGLLLDNNYIDKNNTACKMMAFTLFERGVGAIQVHSAPTVEESGRMLSILAMKREDVLNAGGVELLWKNSGIKSIDVFLIRYDLFTGTEEDQLKQSLENEGTKIWEQFVRMLVADSLGGSVPGLDPAALASMLNRRYAENVSEKMTGVQSALEILRGGSSKAETEGSQATNWNEMIPAGDGYTSSTTSSFNGNVSAPSTKITAELVTFIRNLDPALRRQIIDGFCDTFKDKESAEELCNQVGIGLVKDAYASAQEYAAAPELLKSVIERIAANSAAERESEESLAEKRRKVKLLLQEHKTELYVPEEYFKQLKDFISGSQLSPLDQAEIKELLNSLDTLDIENKTSEIILQLVIADPTGADAAELIQNLADLCGSFLETGDYSQVLKVFLRAADPALPASLRQAMRDSLCRREFLDEIIIGLTVWGKPKYDEVKTLIQIVGTPFIEPLLDRLAIEENLSLRRFLMDRIQQFGSSARDQITARLNDDRWFYVRNLILLLRVIDPAQSIDKLRPLYKHPNQKVRQEVTRSLLIAGDPIVERQLLRDLSSSDKSVLLAAIHIADIGRSPEIPGRLVSIICDGGFSTLECEIKSAAIHSLAATGNTASAKALVEKILPSRSLLNSKPLNRLKVEIVKSLERYPQNFSMPILNKLASGNDELARQAAESLKNLRGA